MEKLLSFVHSRSRQDNSLASAVLDAAVATTGMSFLILLGDTSIKVEHLRELILENDSTKANFVFMALEAFEPILG